MRAFKVWIALVRYHQPECVLHEITPDPLSREMLASEPSDMYKIQECFCKNRNISFTKFPVSHVLIWFRVLRFGL